MVADVRRSGSSRLVRSVWIAVGLSASAAVSAIVATAVALSGSNALLDDASRWSEHVLAVKSVEVAAHDFVVHVAQEIESPGALGSPSAEEAAQAALAAAGRSRALADRFSPEEVRDEQEITRAVEELVLLGREALKKRSRSDLLGVMRFYHAEVSPRVDERVGDEEQGARAAVAAARGRSRLVLLSVALACAALIGAAVWVSLSLARRVAHGLVLLQEGALRLSEGELAHRVPLEPEDELGGLALAFNGMARALRENTVTRGELARQVTERTAELERSRAELEENLARLTETQAQLVATERMAAVGSLAAGVAHEINNPMSFVLSNVNFALDAWGDPARWHEDQAEATAALREAAVGAERVRAIVKGLMAFSRAEEDRSGPVNVEAVLEATFRLAWNAIKHQALLVREYRPVPSVELSEGRLGQLVVNLVMNALDAMPERDPLQNVVRVRTRTSSDGWAVIEVSDNGSGISPEVRARLFDAFFTTKSKGAGTGLGLSICKHIVDSAGGRLSVETAPGRGSTFRIELPPAKKPAEALPPPAPAPAAPPPAARARVLVVDDEPMVGASLRRALSAHDVVSVTSAREALARIEGGERFDVILCDVMMPGMSGPELYAELDRRGSDAARRLVFLTGGAVHPSTREFLARTPAAVLEKPFDAAALRALVAAAVSEARRDTPAAAS